MHRNNDPLAQAPEPADNYVAPNVTLQGQVKVATILMIAFLAEHNLPFLLMDHFPDLCRKMFPDSNIARNLHMRRTKATELTLKFGATIAEDLAEKLRRHPFSIIIDETTDTSKTKSLAIIVKFFDTDAGEGYIKTRLLDLLDVYGEEREQYGSSSEAIYNMIIETLNNYNIPHNNMIGFAADGTNSMMGEHNSVSSRLRRFIPKIVIFKCVCHSLHIAASEAAKKLPKICEDVVKNIYSHFSASAKRVREFEDYEYFFDMSPHKFVHPSQTRWLSMHQAVERVVLKWDALMAYFEEVAHVENLRSITQLLVDMKDLQVFLCLNFLKDMLPVITGLNVLFQSEGPTVHLVYHKLNETYKLILIFFCEPAAVQRANFDSFDPADPANHKADDNIYMGITLHGIFNKEPYNSNRETYRNLVRNMKARGKDFYIVLCQEIRKRFDLNDNFLYFTSFLKPDKIVHPRSRLLMPDLFYLTPLCNSSFNYDVQKLDFAWRLLDVVPLPPRLKE